MLYFAAMKNVVTILVRSIFQKESLQDCSLEELQNTVRQYPYFTPALFLLAEKLRPLDEALHKQQLQKLSLHINNPLWLDFLLNGYITEPEREEIKETMEETTKVEVHDGMEPGIPQTSELQNNEHNILSISQPEPSEQSKETELSFEPFHTVDYFASQGIRYVQEEKPTDRFGKQLKSFTEWLKTMKRLPETEIAKNTDESAEVEVQQLADHSITDDNVVTETMAEVWLKQGNKEKAIEVYNKLSLLNPSKNHYFAAKIEQLKNS